MKLLKPETPEYKKFEDEVRKRTAEPPFNYVIPEDEDVSLVYSINTNTRQHTTIIAFMRLDFI